MKYLILISTFFLPAVALGAVANIDRIVFVSDPQIVMPNTISKTLTIQTQNVNGEMETIDETSDLSVSVNSLTGQFNSNNTTWNPTDTFTMSKNTGNKNFYYQDSVLGTYIITATLTTRMTGKSWTTSQEIIISEEVLPPVSEGEVLGVSTSTSATVSTHYVQENISTYKEPMNIFEVSAGRGRLGYIGMPVQFIVKAKISDDLQDKNCRYVWTFGDSTSANGERADHIYKYAGNYNVVLNGQCGSLKSVSRTTVKINDIDLGISSLSDGAVQIINNGSDEINLYGLTLVNNFQDYIIPIDTIIEGSGQVIFPKEYTKIDGSLGVALLDGSGKMIVVDEVMTFVERYKQLTFSQN